MKLKLILGFEIINLDTREKLKRVFKTYVAPKMSLFSIKLLFFCVIV